MNEYVIGLVSVIMPTYKRSEKLTRAIESVLNQSYTNLELLLVNDNDPSDEYTQELFKRTEKYFDDDRFRLVMQEKHINGAVARNVGIKRAKGEYIALLDDDDWWESDKIEKQVSILSSLSNEWGGVSCRKKCYYDTKLISQLPKYKDGLVYKDVLMLKSEFSTGTLLLRHKALDESGYFDENLLRHQDVQLLVDFTSKFKLMQLDEFLFCCDVSDAQNRPNGEKLLQHKIKFFESVKPVMETLKKSEKKAVYCIHSYELGYVFLKNKKFLKGFRYCARVLLSSKATSIAISKTLTKIKNLLLKKELKS